MRLSHNTNSLLAAAMAACVLTWAFTAVAVAQPADAKPIVVAGQGQPPAIGDHSVPDPAQVDAVLADIAARQGHPPTIGDHSVPNPAQVDAVLAEIKQDRADAAVAASASSKDSDIDTVALVLSVAAILTALGAVTLTVTTRGRLLGT